MRKVFYLTLVFLVGITASVYAQATIGSSAEPHKSAVLDLQSNNNRGLLLPKVSLTNVTVFGLENEAEKATAYGMAVYNTNPDIVGGNGVGMYVWDGTKWMSKTTDIPIPDPETLPFGAAKFTGKVCFDIGKREWNDSECGVLSWRTSRATDFSENNKVTYTFTASGGAAKNVRFVFVDDNDLNCVESISGGEPGTVNDGEQVELTVTYKNTLSDLDGGIYERTRSNAAKVKLYAVYNDGAQDVTVPLTVNIRDCACCGAKTVDGGWLEFMCHNLGASPSIDPFTYVQGDINGDGSDGTLGHYYQWGRVEDGHQKRNSEGVYKDNHPYQIPNNELDGIGQVPSTHEFYGKFFLGGDGDWRQTSDNTLWSSPKTDSDPCPDGWKVPSQANWASITIRNQVGATPGDPNLANTLEWIDYGLKIGQDLFLPFTGYRGDNGFLYLDPNAELDNGGKYWTTREEEISGGAITFVRTTGKLSLRQAANNRKLGYTVRCVSDIENY